MSKYSVVIIVPTAYRDAVNAAAEANGHGPDNINIPLSADGNAPATHYGTRTLATQAFLVSLDGYPEALRSQAHINYVADAPGIGAGHWAAQLAAHNLQRIVEET